MKHGDRIQTPTVRFDDRPREQRITSTVELRAQPALGPKQPDHLVPTAPTGRSASSHEYSARRPTDALTQHRGEHLRGPPGSPRVDGLLSRLDNAVARRRQHDARRFGTTGTGTRQKGESPGCEQTKRT